MSPEAQLIKDTLDFYERASLICGAVFAPLAVAFVGGAILEMAKERGIDIRSRLLTAYLNLRHGPNRILDPHETTELTKSHLAQRISS